jgi:hypothetical protein
MGSPMKNEIYFDDDRKIICCSLEGELDIDKSIVLSKDLRKKASELGFNVFYDARKLYVNYKTLPDDFTTKLSTLIEKLSNLLEIPSQRIVRVAILYEMGKYDEYWRFYEAVAFNRGLTVKIFTNKEESIKWLSDSTFINHHCRDKNGRVIDKDI